jgi:hypothetical protein
MITSNFLVGKGGWGRPARETDNLAAIYELIVYIILQHQSLNNPMDSTTCHRVYLPSTVAYQRLERNFAKRNMQMERKLRYAFNNVSILRNLK